MPFNVERLVDELFPEPPPRRAAPRAPAEPQEPRTALRATAHKPAPPRPVNRLIGALPSPSPDLSEWLAIWKRAPEVTLPPKPCWWCGRSVFWLSTYGAYRCGRCHPPAFASIVRMWVRVVPTEDGPQVVRLGDTPSTE